MTNIGTQSDKDEKHTDMLMSLLEIKYANPGVEIKQLDLKVARSKAHLSKEQAKYIEELVIAALK